jgi:hypothetical protein
MIQVKLTTTNGETKTIPFYNKKAVEDFIGFFPAKLPKGVAVCIDAPLIGIHSGWVIGKKEVVVEK